MKNKVNQLNQPQNDALIELIGENIKTVIIIIRFHMFKKREKRLNMLEICKIQKRSTLNLL